MDDHAILSRLEVANRIAQSAGKITLKYFQTDRFSVDFKGDGSPLTVADREAEQHLRDEITKAFPEDAIVGEEFDDKPGSSGFGWILDPIDGTKSFISGVPLYGTMVAVEAVNQDADAARSAIIGSIYFPGLGEGAYAAKGHGAFSFQDNQPPQPASVSTQADISKSLLLTTDFPRFGKRELMDSFVGLAKEFYFSRSWGDVYGYYLVAVGRAEVMIDPILNVWDAAAVQPIIEEAGGKFTDWSGQPSIDSGDVVASNGQFHDHVLERLRCG